MQDPGMDIRAYWRIFRKWWWVLGLGVVGAVLIAFFLNGTLTPIYGAKAKILVQGRQTPRLPSVGETEASQQLARNYSDLIKTRPIQLLVVQQLSLPYGPGTLSGKISVSSPRSLIEIRVSDPDPELAAKISNTTARTFIDEFRSRQFLQIAQFQASLSQYGIVQDPSIIAAQASTMSTLSIVEEALAPSAPSSPRTRINMMIAAVLGLLAAGLVVVLLEYLDNSIKSSEELKAITGMAVLSAVMRYQPRNGLGPLRPLPLNIGIAR